MIAHKSKSNKTASKMIIEKGDAIIELIENYPCNSRQEATRREGWHQRNSECVNQNIAGRTQKEYREDNHDHIRDIKREYRKNNKDHINEMQREHYNKNIDVITEKQRVRRWAKIFGFGNNIGAFEIWESVGMPNDKEAYYDI
jgi:galactokinase